MVDQKLFCNKCTLHFIDSADGVFTKDARGRTRWTCKKCADAIRKVLKLEKSGIKVNDFSD